MKKTRCFIVDEKQARLWEELGFPSPGAARQDQALVSLLQALMSLFVLSSKDGWVNIMYDGLDAVGIDQQVPVLQSPAVPLSPLRPGGSRVFEIPGRSRAVKPP